MVTPYTLTTNKEIIQWAKDRQYICTDPHVHTIYSDGCLTLKGLIQRAKHAGFQCIMKADHNTTKGNSALKQLCAQEGLVFLPAIEISSKNQHIVAINIEQWTHGGGKNIADCIEKIHIQNGIAVAAHPWWRIGQKDHIFHYKNLDGFEGLNHSSPLGSYHFIHDRYLPGHFEHLNPHKIPVWVGGDSHAGFIYGQYWMIFHTNNPTPDAILECIYHKKYTAYGPILPFWGLFIDGAINQPVQLKKALFYKP